MVITQDSLENLPAEERIKRLKALREQRRKELEKLLEEKEAELSSTEGQLQRSEDDLLAEEHQLEERVEDAPPEEENNNYAIPLEQQLPHRIYEFTDYNIYDEVRRMQEGFSTRGYLTSAQQDRLRELQEQGQAIQNSYDRQQLQQADQGRSNYLSRTTSLIDSLADKLHDTATGLHRL